MEFQKQLVLYSNAIASVFLAFAIIEFYIRLKNGTTNIDKAFMIATTLLCVFAWINFFNL